MVTRVAVLAIIAILRCNNGVAAEHELTQADIAKIKRVCRSLVGLPAWRPYEIFRSQLASYVRSKQDLEESRIVTCSGACGGALILRGGAEIYYGYPNPVGEAHYIRYSGPARSWQASSFDWTRKRLLSVSVL